MPELKLSILKKDIENTSYIDTDDCAITRALARAGRSDLVDEGTNIGFKNSSEIFIDYFNKTYDELSRKVRDMYYGKQKPADFTHTLIY